MVGRGNILIADEEINLCRVLAAELGKAGYDVVCVHDGTRAVEEIRQADYQVTILSIRMPLLDGLDILQSIRSIEPDMPIIVMTAYEYPDVTNRALSAGANICLTKPFDLERICGCVKALLDDHMSERQTATSSAEPVTLFRKHQPISIEFTGGLCHGVYVSTIVGSGDNTLIVSWPTSKGQLASKGMVGTVNVGFSGEDAYYNFEAAVVAKQDGDSPVIVLSKPSVIYRTQRRMYARVRRRLPVDISFTAEGHQGTETRQIFTVDTEDVSAGGLRIITSERFPEGVPMHIDALHIPGGLTVSADGRIVHTRSKVSDGRLYWTYGVRFTMLDEPARSRLSALAEGGMLT